MLSNQLVHRTLVYTFISTRVDTPNHDDELVVVGLFSDNGSSTFFCCLEVLEVLTRGCTHDLCRHCLSPVVHLQYDQIELQDTLHDEHFLLVDPFPRRGYLAFERFERDRRFVTLVALRPPRVQTFRNVRCHHGTQEPLGTLVFRPLRLFHDLVQCISAMLGYPHQLPVEIGYNRRPPRLRNAVVEAVPVLGCTFAMTSRVRCPARERAEMIVIRVESTPTNITLI